MLDFFTDMFGSLFSLLPDSFIQNATIFTSEDVELISNYINYLNWFIPFDIASTIMSAWLLCVLSYYLSGVVQSITNNLLTMFSNDA